MTACPWPAPASLWCLGQTVSKVVCLLVRCSPLGLAMWVSIGSEAACSAALRQALDDYGVFDTDALQAVLETDAAGFARALCTSLQTEALHTDRDGHGDRRNDSAECGHAGLCCAR